ncbi:hypothetical protein F4803DRAFT_523467 [Xylaria telfairii]|nr:hypothetical protein F4803DRAFT_523467 [Xylaria telfairii]
MMFFPCHLVEKTSNEELDEFLRNVCNPRQMPAEVQMFLQGYGPDGTWSTPRKTILPIEVIEAVMCAEIWCAWASRKQSPLPSCQAFIALFQPTTATHVKGLANRLQKRTVLYNPWFQCIATNRYHSFYKTGIMGTFSLVL